MRTPFGSRMFGVVALCLGALVSCSQEEAPAPAPAAPAVEPATAQPAAKPAPAAEAKPSQEKMPTEFKEPEGTGEPGALTAFADADEIVGDVPHSVKLNVDVIDNTGHPPFTYIWDFGDATEFSSDQAPTHVYKVPGSFRASVIVKDSKGETDQDYVDISVNEPLPEGAMTVEQLKQLLPYEELLRQHREQQAKQQGKQPDGGAGPGSKQPPEE